MPVNRDSTLDMRGTSNLRYRPSAGASNRFARIAPKSVGSSARR